MVASRLRRGRFKRNARYIPIVDHDSRAAAQARSSKSSATTTAQAPCDRRHFSSHAPIWISKGAQSPSGVGAHVIKRTT